MYPRLLPGISSYFFMWGVAGVVALTLGLAITRLRGNSSVKRMVVGVLLVGSILLGARVLYVAESHLYPDQDYVPEGLRGMAHGFRIPGGVALLALAAPLLCRIARLPWPQYGDDFAFVAVSMLLPIRLGCFLNGCCFGTTTSVPWGMTFPRDSWVYFYQVTRGMIPATAEASLPTHPLQLYFLGAASLALVLMIGVLWIDGRPGLTYRTFFAVFFATTLLLEPLRANQLTLNNHLALGATVLATLSIVSFPHSWREIFKVRRLSRYH